MVTIDCRLDWLYPQTVNPNTPLLPCFGQTFSYGNENSNKSTLGSCALYDSKFIFKIIYDNHITGSSVLMKSYIHSWLFYLLLSAFTGTRKHSSPASASARKPQRNGTPIRNQNKQVWPSALPRLAFYLCFIMFFRVELVYLFSLRSLKNVELEISFVVTNASGIQAVWLVLLS